MTDTAFDRVKAAFADNPGPLIEWAAERLVHLGQRVEWSMEDNFNTTETLVMLAPVYGLPDAGNQTQADVDWYTDGEESP